jgi:hypothetical protein
MQDTESPFSRLSVFIFRSQQRNSRSVWELNTAYESKKMLYWTVLFPIMNKALLYFGSLVVCGGLLGLMGLSSVVSGDMSLVTILLSISGIGLLFSAVYEITISSNSSDRIPDDRILWSTVVLTLIAVGAGIWSVVV